MPNYPAPRDIPPGKILMAEYGDPCIEGNRAIVERINAAAPRAGFPGGHQIDKNGIVLEWSSPGFRIAGSVMTWTNGYWRVGYFNTHSNTRQGRTFSPDDAGETKARLLFATWTGQNND